MSLRALGLAAVVVGVVLGTWGGVATAAAPKVYRKPATVPAVRVVAPATQRADVWPVPTEGEVERATKLVREAFAEAYRAGAAVGKRREAAKELLRQGVDTRDDAAARYVLLHDAAAMAAGAGDAPTAVRAVEELSRSYAVDPVEMTARTLVEAAKGAFTREAVDGLVACCLRAAEQAVVADRYDEAGRLVTVAEAAADRGHRVDLKVRAEERRKELDALRAGGEEYARAREALTRKSDDAEASLAAGRFLCFVKGDWDAGLPLLAAGSDEGLRAAAAGDMANPQDPSGKAQVGGGWWNVAGRLSGVMRAQARQRAVFWYRQAVGASGLAGVSAKVAQDRLREVRDERMRAMNLVPGLVAEVYEGVDFARRRVTRVDPRVDFEWQEKDSPGEGIGRDNFSILWRGVLSVPLAGQYTFAVVANTGAELTVGGTVVIPRSDMTRKRSGERASVRLDEGVHPVELRFWDTTGLGRVRLSWVVPGGTKEEVVPAEALWHEAGEVATTGR